MSRSGRALLAAFAANAAIVVAIWWVGLEPNAFATLAGKINALGRITALAGTYLLLVQLILRTHIPWLVHAFDTDALKALHTKNAYLALGLIGLHVVLQPIGYALQDATDLAGEVGLLLAHYEGMVLAFAGLALLAVLVVLSLDLIRHRVAWPLWRSLHLYFYAAVALSVPHVIATGADFYDAPVPVAYWTALQAAVVAILLIARVPPLWRVATAAGRPHPAVVALGAAVLAAYLFGTIRLSGALVPSAAAAPSARPSAGPIATPAVTTAPLAGPDRTVEGELVGTQYGLLQVRVILSGTRIVDVEPVELPGGTKRSSGISGAAEIWLRKRAIAAQSAQFEIISGATYTSYAYQRSLDAALRSAGIHP